MKIDVIEFKKRHDKDALKLFYRTVFYNRKEFEYARIPSWSHRYSLENHSVKRLAIEDSKIIGSLGLMSYDGYVNGTKQRIGFFVDNCILPEYNQIYDQIMSKLFQDIEKQAKKDRIEFILGWEYTRKADIHNALFKKMGYYRIDGINWFGSGAKHVHVFSEEGENLSLLWRIALNLMNYKFRLRERKLESLKNGKIRPLRELDIPSAVKLINDKNRDFLFSPKYTKESLKKTTEKYRTKGFVAEIDGKIVGVLILFVAPWSGWMYGKPEYTQSYTFFLINHPLEFAVIPEYAEQVAPHLLFAAMKNEKQKYLMLVNVFDRRISCLRKAFFDAGADELSYDYGTVFFKSLSGKKIKLTHPFYIPTNLIISPYTTKDY